MRKLIKRNEKLKKKNKRRGSLVLSATYNTQITYINMNKKNVKWIYNNHHKTKHK